MWTFPYMIKKKTHEKSFSSSRITDKILVFYNCVSILKSWTTINIIFHKSYQVHGICDVQAESSSICSMSSSSSFLRYDISSNCTCLPEPCTCRFLIEVEGHKIRISKRKIRMEKLLILRTFFLWISVRHDF